MSTGEIADMIDNEDFEDMMHDSDDEFAYLEGHEQNLREYYAAKATAGYQR